MSLSLEKKITKLNLEKSPKLVSLAKKANESISKKGFEAHQAQVALVMDISGSMSGMFKDGTVQEIIGRIMALGINFDDNAAIDIFAFGEHSHNLGELTPKDFDNAADWILRRAPFEGNTKYANPMVEIAQHYGFVKTESTSGFLGFGKKTQEVWQYNSQFEHPIYVLFVTDGTNNDEQATREILIKLSNFPVFFQFVGIGNASFKFLEELDNISGRNLDNANFFAVKDPIKMSPELMFDNMMNEYPDWVKEVKKKGWIK